MDLAATLRLNIIRPEQGWVKVGPGQNRWYRGSALDNVGGATILNSPTVYRNIGTVPSTLLLRTDKTYQLIAYITLSTTSGNATQGNVTIQMLVGTAFALSFTMAYDIPGTYQYHPVVQNVLFSAAVTPWTESNRAIVWRGVRSGTVNIRVRVEDWLIVERNDLPANPVSTFA